MELSLMSLVAKSGLREYEFAALIGAQHSAALRIDRRDWERHNSQTCSVIWFMYDCPTTFVQSQLRRWLIEKPKNKNQVDILVRIAKRRLSNNFYRWHRDMQEKYPEFF